MSNNTDKTSFWKFLKKNSIEIPIIQRDYAQGRLGKEYLRKKFLTSLMDALEGKELKLDFIYGSVENDHFNPLDGQQRLTTLWLLHWYIALRAGKLSDASETLKKFSYETRISSREFCQNLCNPNYFEKFDGNDVVGFITNQTWFYSAWKQDPTIQSMLRMLSGTKIADRKGDDIIDGIEEIFIDCDFNKYKEYWGKLTENDVIVFYNFSLKDFGLSDDLYIKMNARGKQLTSFENFKADLVGYIRNQVDSLEEMDRKKWESLLDKKRGIPIKMDTTWTDIFWNNKSTDYKIDEIFFVFLNRFFWNELFTAKEWGVKRFKQEKDDGFILDIGKGDETSTQENNNASYRYLNNSYSGQNDYDTTISYQGLDVYKYYDNEIPYQLFSDLQVVMDTYYTWSEKQSKLSDLFCCPWDKDFRFIPEYEKKGQENIEISDISGNKIWKVTPLTQIHRIIFFAVCKYFKEFDNNVNFDEPSLQRWMRVVWNLVSGESPDGKAQIRSTKSVRDAISFIDKLDSHHVYESLIRYSHSQWDKPSEFDSRCIEEINKAQKILDENGELRKYEGTCTEQGGTRYHTWEDIIIDAEKTAFFKGAIRFLFTNENGEVCWDDFDNKFEHSRKFFNDKGVSDEYKKANILRALLSRIDISEKWFSEQVTFWRTELLNENRSIIHELLTNEPSVSENCREDWITNDVLLPVLFEKQSTWHILRNWRGYNVLTRYSNRIDGKVNHWEEVVVISHPRNSLLFQQEIEIKEEQEISKANYLFGWDIDFKYNGYYFRWYGNPSEKELDVYLMEDKWRDYQKRQNQIPDNNTDESVHFCFRVNETITPNVFLANLDCLISQKKAEEKNLPCMQECEVKNDLAQL